MFAPPWPYHPIENPAPLLGVYRVRGTLLSFSLKISRKPFNQTLLLSKSAAARCIFTIPLDEVEAWRGWVGVYQFARILIGVHVVGTPAEPWIVEEGLFQGSPCTEPFEFLGQTACHFSI
jgi:hypothetical protein